MPFDLLEKPVGTLDLLLYLLSRGTSSVSDILTGTGMNSDTFQRAASHLKNLRFVYEDRRVGFPTYRFLGLTQEGEAVARALAPAGDLLANTVQALDSELGRLEDAHETSTISRRLDLLELLVDREFAAGAWDAARDRGSRLAALAKDSGDTRREAHGHLSLGRILQKRDQHDEALKELGEAVALAGLAKSSSIASQAEYLIGSSWERRGQWATALEHFHSAEDLAARSSDPLARAVARQAMARVLGRQGKLRESAGILREVIQSFEGLGADEELPKAYGAMGATAYSLNERDAVQWQEKAIEAARRIADPRMEAWGMANAAASLIDARDYAKALVYLKRAFAIFDDLGEQAGLAAAELNLGNLAAAQDHWSDGEGHFQEALRISRETRNRQQEASVLLNQGQMMIRRGKPTEARAFLTEAKRIFTEIGNEARAKRCDEELRSLTE